MAAFTLINDWLDNMVENADLASDQFTVALSNTAPGAEGSPPTGDGDGILGNVTQVGYADCSARAITNVIRLRVPGTNCRALA